MVLGIDSLLNDDSAIQPALDTTNSCAQSLSNRKGPLTNRVT